MISWQRARPGALYGADLGQSSVGTTAKRPAGHLGLPCNERAGEGLPVRSSARQPTPDGSCPSTAGSVGDPESAHGYRLFAASRARSTLVRAAVRRSSSLRTPSTSALVRCSSASSDRRARRYAWTASLAVRVIRFVASRSSRRRSVVRSSRWSCRSRSAPSSVISGAACSTSEMSRTAARGRPGGSAAARGRAPGYRWTGRRPWAGGRGRARPAVTS